MNLSDLLAQLFPDGCAVTTEQWLVCGEAVVDGKTVAVLGTTGRPFIGIREAVVLSEKLLALMERHPGRTIIMLVENEGQRLAFEEELLALPEYLAHLLRTQQAVRLAGSKLVAVVYGSAMAGGFIAFGLGADRVISVPGAQPSVMKLEAIARVTKLPIERLRELAAAAPVFAPGCESFYQVGGLDEMWTDRLGERLRDLLARDMSEDSRTLQAEERGGRRLAHSIIHDVLEA